MSQFGSSRNLLPRRKDGSYNGEMIEGFFDDVLQNVLDEFNETNKERLSVLDAVENEREVAKRERDATRREGDTAEGKVPLRSFKLTLHKKIAISSGSKATWPKLIVSWKKQRPSRTT